MDTSCIVCAGDTRLWLSTPVDVLNAQPTDYGNVYRCSNCALGSVRPVPPAEKVPAFYANGEYYTHAHDPARQPRMSFPDKLLTRLAWTFDKGEPFSVEEMSLLLPPGGSVVDLGCGHGALLKRYQELGFPVLGVDPDEAARSNAPVPILAGTAEHLPRMLIGRQFDQVIMTHSLEHCLDPIKALANAYALTRPGGYFYCEVPNCSCTHFRMFGACSLMFDAPRHLHFFEPGALCRLIRRAGFIPLQSLFWGFTRQHLPDWRAWECTISARIGGVRHSYARSFWLLARTALANRRAKYDSVGILARRPDH